MTSPADLGQFFLEDETIFEEIITLANLSKEDVVLEIGAGDGRLTKLLAQKAGKIVALEIDPDFLPQLKSLPKKVTVENIDALDYLTQIDHKKFNKIVSNLPSSLVEPLFKQLPFIKFQSAVLLVPEKFAQKVIADIVLSAYFEINLGSKVNHTAFNPQPKTNWRIVQLKKIELKEIDKVADYLIRFINEHPQTKVKNSLMEGLIRFYQLKGKTLTKNEARKIIATSKFPLDVLENLPNKDFSWEKLVKVEI